MVAEIEQIGNLALYGPPGKGTLPQRACVADPGDNPVQWYRQFRWTLSGTE